MWGKRVFNCLYTSALNLVINLAVLPSLDAARRTHMPGMQKSLNVTYLGRVKRGKGMAGYINQPVISLWVTGHPLPSPLRLPCSPPLSPPAQFGLWFRGSCGRRTWCREKTRGKAEHDGTTGCFGPSSWRVSLDHACLWLYGMKCPSSRYWHRIENCPSRWELLADTAAWGWTRRFCTEEKGGWAVVLSLVSEERGWTGGGFILSVWWNFEKRVCGIACHCTCLCEKVALMGNTAF